MKEKEYKTLSELIKANQSFSCALKDDRYPNNNLYISFELALIYLRANMDLLREYSIEIYNFVMQLMNNKRYYIEGNAIYIENKSYPLDEFIGLVYSLEEYKHRECFIPRIAYRKSEDNGSKDNCKIYSFEDYLKLSEYEMSERDLVFQFTMRVDKETRPYINKVNDRFRKFISSLVINYLKDNKAVVSIKELMVIASYINLVPLFFNEEGLIDFPFGMIKIPKAEIGTAKIIFDDPQVVDVNKRMMKISNKRRELELEEGYMRLNGIVNEYMIRVRQKINLLKEEEINLLCRLYELTELEHIYNPTFFKSLWECFWNNSVDINNLFDNPILKLFLVKGNVTRFYAAMHLDTLFNLIDNDDVLKILDSDKKLLLAY